MRKEEEEKKRREYHVKKMTKSVVPGSSGAKPFSHIVIEVLPTDSPDSFRNILFRSQNLTK